MNQDVPSKAIYQGEIEGYHGSFEKLSSVEDFKENHEQNYTRGHGLYLVTEEGINFINTYRFLHKVKAKGKIVDLNTKEGVSLFRLQQGKLIKDGVSISNVFDALHENHGIDILITSKTQMVIKNIDSISEIECTKDNYHP